MTQQKGGLKLRNPGKTGFTPIYDMINSPSSSLELLTYRSLKGFMITLNISPEETEYLGLYGVQFTKPITSFILKFAVITPNNDQSLPVFKKIKKSSESKDSYFNEAKLQQQTWKKSISGGRPEICPPVANFSLFDNSNSKDLLAFLQTKTSGTLKPIVDYLLNCITSNSQYGIGVISMPKVEMSDTFGNFIDSPKNSNFYGIKVNNETKNDVYASVSSKIVRLFIDIGVIHFDLHSGNALVYKSNDNQINSLIIDFGRASNITNNIGDEYLTIVEKDKILNDKKTCYDELFKIGYDAPDDKKVKFITTVLDYISNEDHEKNQAIFQFSDRDRYQMDWYENIRDNDTVKVKAFDLLKKSIEVSGTSSMLPATIVNYEKKGYLVNFNNNVDSFVVPFTTQPSIQSTTEPSIQSTKDCDDNPGSPGCTLSGGKKRTRKIRKNKQSRKIKKSRKNRY